jgi:WD40 repeat protein
MNEITLVGKEKTDSLAVAFEQARNHILQKFIPMRHTVHGVGIGHTNVVNAGAFTLDGKGLLTASWDGTAILWDIQSGLPVRRFLGHEGPLRALCLTTGGRTFVTGGDDCTARMWDMNTGQCLHVFREHRGAVECVYATADGLELLTAGLDATAIVWSMATMRRAKVLEGHKDNVSCVCLSRDGSRIITASFDKNVHVYDRASGELLRVLRGVYSVNWVCTTPEDRIVAAYADNSCWLWTMEGKTVRKYVHHKSTMLRRVAEKEHWFGRAKSFISSDNVRENATILGSINSCSSVAAPMHDPYFFSTGWDGTCRQIAYDGQQIRCLKGHERPVERVVLSKDDNTVATLGWDARTVIWDVKSGKPRKTLSGFTNTVMGLALSPDGGSLVTVGGPAVTVWDLSQGHPRLRLTSSAGQTAIAYSPNGEAILTGDLDGEATFWSTDTGAKKTTFRCGNAISQAAFSPDGRIAAIGCLNGHIVLYDMRYQMVIQRLGGLGRGISCLAFTPDSTRVLAGSGENTLRMFDVNSARQMLRLTHSDEVRCVGLNEAGAIVATGSLNGELCLWELRTGRKICSVQAHLDGVNVVLFMRGGKRLTAGQDGLVRLWKGEDPMVCQAVGRGHLDKVFCMALSPDGRFLFTGGQDHTVRCWDLRSPEIGEGAIPLLASLVHLERGFLWTTPPAPSENAPSGWLWTDRKDLIRVMSQAGDVETPVGGAADRDQYFALYSRKDMVINRFWAPNEYMFRSEQIRQALYGAHTKSLEAMEASLRRRLGPGRASAGAGRG